MEPSGPLRPRSHSGNRSGFRAVKLNKRQQALYDRVVAEGGTAVVTTTMTLREGRRRGDFTGYAEQNAMASMLPKWQRDYVPGGFSRQVSLMLVGEETIDRTLNIKSSPDEERPKGAAWMEKIHNCTVRLATAEEIERYAE